MKNINTGKTAICVLSLVAVQALAFSSSAMADRKFVNFQAKPNLQVGSDLNSIENSFIQPQSAAESGGGRDQTLQFGDVIAGSVRDDLQFGKLGIDILSGGHGDDIIIGGLEHFNPPNRDRAFGGNGNDIFIWKPGDGSDLFRGGRGLDTIVFGLTGEIVDGRVDFSVINNDVAGELAIDHVTGLPSVDVTNSPGFCEVIDRNTSAEAAEELKKLDLDHLVRFSIRGVRDSFEAGAQSDDNGLRVTLHLKDVEVLVCTDRHGGAIEVLDLTRSPATPISLSHIRSFKLRNRLSKIVF